MPNSWETNVPTPENPASRWNRDAVQERGDFQMATGTLANNLDVTGKLTYKANSRVDRMWSQRRGDWYTVETTNSLDTDANLVYDATGRNDREYVDRTSKKSAITNKTPRELA